MRPVVNHVWIPVRGTPYQWHHFIVTKALFCTSCENSLDHNGPCRRLESIRVAYERVAADGKQLSSTPDADTDYAASWNLDRVTAEAWTSQRNRGYDGTSASLWGVG